MRNPPPYPEMQYTEGYSARLDGLQFASMPLGNDSKETHDMRTGSLHDIALVVWSKRWWHCCVHNETDSLCHDRNSECPITSCFEMAVYEQGTREILGDAWRPPFWSGLVIWMIESGFDRP